MRENTAYPWAKDALIILALITIMLVGAVMVMIGNANDTACVEPVPVHELDSCIDVYYVRESELIGMQLCMPEE